MARSTAERNKKKRERKKQQRDEKLKQEVELGLQEQLQEEDLQGNDLVEIEYVPQPISVSEFFDTHYRNDEKKIQTASSSASVKIENGDDTSLLSVLERFQSRAAIIVSDTESEDPTLMRNKSNAVKILAHGKNMDDNEDDEKDDDDDAVDSEMNQISKRQLRQLIRPTIAELKNRVQRPDLVEAHDICATDPDFLLHLKSIAGSVPVPRHWGRKRKYLQGKRGTEKVPYALPDFIVKTGIVELRGSTQEDEAKQSVKQKNRSRVAPKMGALDVDYRVLHDAFFKHQNISHMKTKLTPFGDLYYEGKEFETHKHASSIFRKVGGELSDRLKEALGMTASNSPPPWLVNMQRYGPPPSYPNLKIPGLNAPLPNASCSYGYHLNGWGKPPVDAFGRPLYGGNPFDPPGGVSTITSEWDFDAVSGAIVTSDGKTIRRKPWGALPMATLMEREEESDEDEEEVVEGESGEDMDSMAESGEEVDEEEQEGGEESNRNKDTFDSIVRDDGMDSVVPSTAFDLRKKTSGEDTPMPTERKQLYTILQQTSADKDRQSKAVFASDVAYVLPSSTIPEGAESVVSKVMAKDDVGTKKKRNAGTDDDDGAHDIGKKFKF